MTEKTITLKTRDKILDLISHREPICVTDLHKQANQGLAQTKMALGDLLDNQKIRIQYFEKGVGYVRM